MVSIWSSTRNAGWCTRSVTMWQIAPIFAPMSSRCRRRGLTWNLGEVWNGLNLLDPAPNPAGFLKLFNFQFFRSAKTDLVQANLAGALSKRCRAMWGWHGPRSSGSRSNLSGPRQSPVATGHVEFRMWWRVGITMHVSGCIGILKKRKNRLYSLGIVGTFIEVIPSED
jgi:hypothetical protein